MSSGDVFESKKSARRILLVHAHPDDETIGNGATMALYKAKGAQVTLVTCTHGEEGEVLVPALEYLRADREDQLGEYRTGELARAMAHLGVTDHLFLGAPQSRYRDSGMIGTPANERSDSFWQADLEKVALELVEIIRDRKPHVLITYDENGGYGHPDHIKAHQTAMRAAELAADPSVGEGQPWIISKIYWNAIPKSAIKRSLTSKRWHMRIALRVFKYVPSQWLTLPFVQDDSVVTTAIDGSEFLNQKLDALSEHKTQLVMDRGYFDFDKNMSLKISGVEHYILAKRLDGVSEKNLPTNGRENKWESDLFEKLITITD